MSLSCSKSFSVQYTWKRERERERQRERERERQISITKLKSVYFNFELLITFTDYYEFIPLLTTYILSDKNTTTELARRTSLN